MNNPNPFVPQGSLLEQQSQRRSRLKLAVFCVLAVSVTGLTGMLIQGCKRSSPESELNPPPLDTNAYPVMDTNYMTMNDVSNPPVVLPPLDTNPPVVLPPVVEPAAGAEYTVVKGDTLAVIAKKHGVSLAALQAANPGVIPTKLKIGQKLVIPAGGGAAGTVAPVVTADTGVTSYTVKSGDTLTRIAKIHGTTIKAIQNANGMVTTSIKVGQKLKIPSKAVAAPVAPAPIVEPAPAPVLPPPTVPAPVPAQ
jgi:LysM repeat protein